MAPRSWKKLEEIAELIYDAIPSRYIYKGLSFKNHNYVAKELQ